MARAGSWPRSPAWRRSPRWPSPRRRPGAPRAIPIVLTLAALALAHRAHRGVDHRGAERRGARRAPRSSRCARSSSRRRRCPAPWAHAGVLLVAAVGSAISGPRGHRSPPPSRSRSNLCGSWRPSGPFEYPPALALVCAGALPVALCAATERRRALAVARSARGLAAGHHRGPDRQPHRHRAVRAGRDRLRGAGAARAPGRAGGARHDRRGRRQRPRSCTATSPAPATAPASLALLPARRRRRRGAAGGRRAQRAARARRWTAARRRRRAAGHGRRRPRRPRLALRRRSQPRARRPLARRAAHRGGASAPGLRGGDLPGRHARAPAARAPRPDALRPRPRAAGVGRARPRGPARGARRGTSPWRRPSRASCGRRGRTAPPGCSAPAVAAFPLANLLDWPWALTGTGVLWAVAVGGLLGGAGVRAGPNVAPARA